MKKIYQATQIWRAKFWFSSSHVFETSKTGLQRPAARYDGWCGWGGWAGWNGQGSQGLNL